MQTLRDVWTRLTLNQRLLIGTIGGAFALAIVITVLWAGKPDYTVLYGNVDPTDAAAIIDELRTRGVSYELRDGGRTILVPSKDVYEARLDLAVDGLPQSGAVGYEIFDKTGFGVTDFVQRLNHRRALEGEISRTIGQLNEVRAARVHIVVPDEALFAEEQKEATASVVLRLKGALGPPQVSGIVRLVAASVEGLRPDNVTIVDTYGNLLSSPKEEDDLASVTNAQLALKADVESYLRSKVVDILEGVLGPGKVVAQVDADLDFERIERTHESYDPESAAVRSEQRVKGTEDEAKNENVTTNYELTKTLEHIVSPVGGIERLTVAVLVDGGYDENEAGELEYAPRSDAEMQQLTSVIRSAVGIDDARGDRLEVHNVAFDNSAVRNEQQAIDRSDRMTLLTDILNRVGQVLVILLLAVLARFFFQRAASAIQTQRTLVAEREAQAAAAAVIPPSEDERYLQLQGEITHLVTQRPEEIGQLVRTWLKED
jgi:flagellar M-ring protein FliF